MTKTEIIVLALGLYVVLVVFSSLIKCEPIDQTLRTRCDIKIPYDYIVYDRLFCEMDVKND